MKLLSSHAELIGDFFKFGMVGAIGFAANIGFVYLLRASLNLYVSGLLAWLAAVTITWYLNRRWIFSDKDSNSPCRQWLKFLAANSLGFALYYIIYSALVTYSEECAELPFLAVCMGAIAGLAANFTLSRYLVFSRVRQEFKFLQEP